MDPIHLAIIWSLVVMLGGFGITGYLLWRDRDHDDDAAERHAALSEWPAILTTWLDARKAARAYTERHSSKTAGQPPRQLSDHDQALLDAVRKAAARQSQTGITPADARTYEHETRRWQLRAWYAEQEERLAQQLLDAGAARWG